MTLVVETPTKLSAEAKDLLKKFDEVTGNSLNAVKNHTEKESKENKESKDSKKKKGFFK